MIRRVRHFAEVTFFLAFLLTSSGAAFGQDLKDHFNFRLSLSGMYLGEMQASPSNAQSDVGPVQLGYGELRAVLDGRRLPGGFEVHLDGRVRITGDFNTESAIAGEDQTSARGYLGGREYEVRQAWVRRRGDRFDFGFGRLMITEADALKLDGARVWWRFVKHWDLSAFAGFYPDPYSRSVTTDYSDLTFVGGADFSYTYDRVWGSFSGVGSYLGGNDDGGALVPTGPSGSPRTENTRSYITWTNYVRFFDWLDLYHDLVLDVAGAAGVQMTRADVMVTARAGKHVTFHLGYDHLSALAIEMDLRRLLNDRGNYLANTIENNLTVQRTARDEGRAQVEVGWKKLSFYGEGRVRHRAIVDPKDDPQFVNAGEQVAPSLAGDATIGLRDRGSLGGMRLGLWATYLRDYRSENALVGFDFGRSFRDEKFSFDAQIVYARTRDQGYGLGCPLYFTTTPTGTPSASALIPTGPGSLSSCFGGRDGSEYEAGLTLATRPTEHWYALLDYRLVIDQSQVTQTANTSNIYTNMLMLRLETRY